jgi:DNA polymerase-3 subunit delta'
MKKYNWQTIGHHKIVQFLQKSLANDRLSHAYLFSGRPNLGKRLMAEDFIRSIFCLDYHQKNKLAVGNVPCQECIFCQQIKRGIHPDVYYLKKEEDKKNISIEQVREMQKLLQMASFLSSYKIALIEDAQDLSESAQNAILKILEEPSHKTILILLTADYNLLLPTIVSRCQVIKFFPIAKDVIYRHLIDLGSTREEARTFTALVNGQLGLAVDYYTKSELYHEYIDKVNLLLKLFDSNIAGQFRILADLTAGFKNNAELVDFLNLELDLWQLVFRDLLAIKHNLDDLVINLHFKDQLVNLAQKYSSPKIVALLKETRKIKQYLNYNINPRLAVENLILNLN